LNCLTGGSIRIIPPVVKFAETPDKEGQRVGMLAVHLFYVKPTPNFEGPQAGTLFARGAGQRHETNCVAPENLGTHPVLLPCGYEGVCVLGIEEF